VRTKLFAAILLVAACLGITLPQSAGASVAASNLSSLVVKVTDLPHGVAGSVTVTGPDRYKRQVRATITLTRLRPGRYTVTAKPVGSHGATFVPSIAGAVRTLKAGHSATSTVAYYTRIPATTKPVAAKDVTSVTAGSGGTQDITVANGGASSVETGDIIAAGIGSATPHGLLVKVTAVTHSGSDETLTTVPATLREAIPQGSLNVTGTFRDASAASAAVAGNPAAPRDLISCGASAGVSIGESVSGSVGTSFESSWSLHGSSVSVAATVHESSEVSADASAGASCTLGPIPIGPELKFAPFDVQVGPVPVVVVPTVQNFVKGSVSVSGDASASVGQQFNAAAGLSYLNGHVTAVHDVSNVTSYTEPTLNGDASLTLTAGPELTLALYGVAGPVINVDAGLELKASTDANPLWQLDAILHAGVSLHVPQLDIDVSDENVISLSRELAAGGISEIIPTEGQAVVASRDGPILGPDGRIWLVATGNASLQAVNIKTHAISTYNLPTDPDSITFDGQLYPDTAGNLWMDAATYNLHPLLVRFTPKTGAVRRFAMPKACPVGGFFGFAGSSEDYIWLTCQDAKGAELVRMGSTGAATTFAVPSQYAADSALTPGPGGTMWTITRESVTLGTVMGLLEVTPKGHFSFFADPDGEQSSFLAGSGKALIDALACAPNETNICYDSVAANGALKQLAVSPNPNGQDYVLPQTAAIDGKGDFWVLISGADVIKTPTGEYFLEVAPNGKVHEYALWAPAVYISDLSSPTLSGPPAFTADGSLWGEITNAIDYSNGMSINGELLRFRP
jgi:hypothetical protein